MASDIHGYYDWQVNTLMLAYDAVDPLAGKDESAIDQRRDRVEMEVRAMAMEILPEEYKQNPEKDITPEIRMMFTRATIEYAAAILNEQ